MAEAPLLAHSLTEAHLYLMATPCELCGKGPLRVPDPRSIDRPGVTVVVSLKAVCANCGGSTTPRFRLPAEPKAAGNDAGTLINPTEEPSRIIDVAQWLTLAQVLTEAASRETDKVQARQLGIDAAQCLAEALKFYDEGDNDLPPAEAFFHEASRRRLRDNPEEFSRERVVNLKSKLPSPSAVRSGSTSPARRGLVRWWRRSNQHEP